MTTATLREYTLKDLAQMAKKRGIQGWHSMRKADLIQAIVKDERRAKRAKAKRSRTAPRTAAAKRQSPTATAKSTRAKTNGSSKTNAKSKETSRAKVTTVKTDAKTKVKKVAEKPKQSRVARQLQKGQRQKEQFKDISGEVKTPKPVKRIVKPVEPVAPGKDRVVLMVRDAYWLHAHWELSSRNVQRAQAAMAENWHTAKPVIRLMEVSTKTTANGAERFVRDIEIHGGVNNWYIDVADPPAGFRVEIGYLAANGHFHSLARSNTVTTPAPETRASTDHTWVDVAENCEQIFALSGGYSDENSTGELQEVLEERLRRPVGSSLAARYGVSSDPINRDSGFKLEVNAEMIVHGHTKPGARVTMGGVPLKLSDDGSFSVRMGLPDRRQVLPITSNSDDGLTEQTVVLAVERNTKIMEAVQRDGQ